MVFVTAYLGGTHGTAKSARDFLRSLLVSSDDVKVVSPICEEFPALLSNVTLSQPEWLTPPIGFNLPRKPWQFGSRMIKSLINDKLNTTKFIKKTGDDLVFINGWASYGYWQSMESYFNGKKVLIVRESPRHFAGPDRDTSLLKMIDVFSRFDHLIFVSDIVRREWLKNNEIRNISCSVLPNCCEEEEATKYLAFDRNLLRQEYGFTPNDFVVFCPGTIEYRKGQDLLLNVVPMLRESIPNLRVLFVGDPVTIWGQNILKSISMVNHESTIIHWNAKPDLFELFRVSDVLAFPSRAEALPRTILEAMVMKTAIVASSVDGVPELIENNRTGVLFECDDSNGLFNGILALFSNPLLRNQFAEAGFSRYWDNFSRRHQFDRMKIILNELQSSNACLP